MKRVLYPKMSSVSGRAWRLLSLERLRALYTKYALQQKNLSTWDWILSVIERAQNTPQSPLGQLSVAQRRALLDFGYLGNVRNEYTASIGQFLSADMARELSARLRSIYAADVQRGAVEGAIEATARAAQETLERDAARLKAQIDALKSQNATLAQQLDTLKQELTSCRNPAVLATLDTMRADRMREQRVLEHMEQQVERAPARAENARQDLLSQIRAGKALKKVERANDAAEAREETQNALFAKIKAIRRATEPEEEDDVEWSACQVCGWRATSVCAKCARVAYCGSACQRVDWVLHQTWDKCK